MFNVLNTDQIHAPFTADPPAPKPQRPSIAMNSKRFIHATLASAGALLLLATSACHNAQKLPEGYAQGDYFGQVHTRGTAPGTPPRGVNIAGVRDSAPDFVEEPVGGDEG